MPAYRRLLGAAGAAMAVVSLWLPWYYTDDGPDTEPAWGVFDDADVVLLACGLALFAACLLPERVAARVRPAVCAGGWVLAGVCLDRVWARTESVFYPAYNRVGIYVAIAGFAVVGAAWSSAGTPAGPWSRRAGRRGSGASA
jgi:hypothetical protein